MHLRTGDRVGCHMYCDHYLDRCKVLQPCVGGVAAGVAQQCRICTTAQISNTPRCNWTHRNEVLKRHHSPPTCIAAFWPVMFLLCCMSFEL